MTQFLSSSFDSAGVASSASPPQTLNAGMMMYPSLPAAAGSAGMPAHAAGIPLNGLPQHQQQPFINQDLGGNTPWTLGSTDGTYALQLALLQKQAHERNQNMLVRNTTDANNSINATGGVDTTSPTSNDDSSSLDRPPLSSRPPQSQSQQQVQSPASGSGGAAIALSGEASVTSSQTPPSVHINTPAPAPTNIHIHNNSSNNDDNMNNIIANLHAKRSLYQDRLFRQPSASVESVLAASCEVMGFDIAEMWLRTGNKTHQLTNSHLRPTALEDSVRKEIVDVYYGEKSSERTHRLSPALCKRAKEANDVVWVTAHTSHGAEALRCSISNVRTAVAVPVCHEASNTNITILFFSIRRILVRPTSVEFLVHMSLGAGVASVNSLAEDGLLDRPKSMEPSDHHHNNKAIAHSEHIALHGTPEQNRSSIAIRHQRLDRYSVTGAQLDLQWRQLLNVEYLTDGGNSWIHTAVYNGRPVVVKTLKPECQDVALAINEIEGELAVHARLNHPNICSLIGAGTTSKGVRFVVLERLDGGTLTQMMGYDTRIRDRRRRFWRKKHFSFLDVMRIARSIAEAMKYCHEDAIPGCIVMHRDLKPDNIGFTLDGTVKILDFGLAKIVENATVDSDDVYTMSGETGSLRYMAPEVADALPYNFMADVYSYGIILWELNAGKKPFDGLNRELFYERVVHGGERPPLHRKWPKELTNLMTECWDADMHNRPKFRDIVARLDAILNKEKGGTMTKKKQFLPKISGMIDRHSTWF